jgi:transposase-like protein
MPDLTLLELMRRIKTEDDARAYFESLRWPDGPVCPHCGNCKADRVHAIKPNPEKKIRPGLYFCAECRAQFTVTVGTVMEDSKIPLSKWLLAFYRMASSKTQVSALRFQRELEIGNYGSALFLCHRIRYALATDGGTPPGKLSGTVEAASMNDRTWRRLMRRALSVPPPRDDKPTAPDAALPCI